MEIEALNCRCCGGVLKVNSALVQCAYCGATNMISDTAGKYINQLNRANKLRQEREFDNAARIYDNILAENPPTSDILWLRTLCEYGIEYVPDPLTGEYIPTLHRVKDESILAYHSYLDALALADADGKGVLKKEAEYIAKIQTEYLDIASKEDPYDVFICYKETDEQTGEKTDDVQVAEELYQILTSKGYKVFFARVTLKSKLSIDYEPYIFAALKSAKAMVVIGTKAEYFMSVWVKNEWGRFLRIMEKDNTKQMFFACDDPEELPRAFATKQAQLLGDDDAIPNLAQNVITFLQGSKSVKMKVHNPQSKEAQYSYALKMVNRRNHAQAANLLDKLIISFPDFGEAYWLRLCNNFKATPGNIMHQKLDITKDPDFEKAIKFSDVSLSMEYEKIAKECFNNLKNQEEFDKILEKESIEYLDNFEKGELGDQKKKMLGEIQSNLKKLDTKHLIMRIIVAAGTSISLITNVIILLILAQPIHSIAQFDTRVMVVSAATLPLLILGLILMFFYSIPANIIANVVVIGLTVMTIINPDLYELKHVLTLVFPAALLFITYQSDTINKYRLKMIRMAYDTLDVLDEYHKFKNKCINDVRGIGVKLLTNFKKEKKIEKAIIELKDDDYFRAIELIEDDYNKQEKKVYNEVKYLVNVRSKENLLRTESGLGIVAVVFSFVPGLNFVGFGIALVDIFMDKHKDSTHMTTTIALLLNIVMMALAYRLFVIN